MIVWLLGCDLPATRAAPSPTPAPAPAAPAPPAPAGRSFDRAASVVFPDGLPPAGEACRAEPDPAPCLLGARLLDARPPDPEALALARQLYRDRDVLVGVVREHTMDGGWRGPIHLVPADPVGPHRQHLRWVAAAFDDFEVTALALDQARPAGVAGAFRWSPDTVRFFRSVDRATPSAYALGWEIAYNVAGSINTSEARVRETLFHELFHANDAAHGGWSARALTPVWRSILDRCGQDTACLAPYAPAQTIVRGATYYAFKDGNGVGEYAAELAIRYYLEQRAAARGAPIPRFACRTPENGEAWQRLVDEFFLVDLGECPTETPPR